ILGWFRSTRPGWRLLGTGPDRAPHCSAAWSGFSLNTHSSAEQVVVVVGLGFGHPGGRPVHLEALRTLRTPRPSRKSGLGGGSFHVKERGRGPGRRCAVQGPVVGLATWV